ncbi:MAG TPA: carboxylesterase [Thiotrichales bacterium]|nr:carboxylesterase [Thiotrichales bacterium]
MDETLPETLVVEPRGAVRASVIWLHGLGADGHDFEPLVPELGLGDCGVRFVFPHAPMRPVTINGGMVMRAWYDIRLPDLMQDIDEAGIRASVAAAQGLVRREMAAGVPAARIVLAGFSQGGVIALQAGLRFGEALAGIMVLSSYLVLPEVLAAETSPANAAAPVFLGHGHDDPLVPLRHAEAARDWLRAQGHPVEFHAYAMPHSVCAEEIADIRAWLRTRLCDQEG